MSTVPRAARSEAGEEASGKTGGPKDLRHFIRQVVRHLPGSIKHVIREIDPCFGCTALAERFARRNEYPAMFFEKVKGSRLPVMINLTATQERLALALGTTVEEMVSTYGELLAHGIPPVEVEVDEAPVKQVVWQGADADLNRLPIPTHNAKDAGPYVTGGMGITRDLETGTINMGLYRHQVHSRNELGVWFIKNHHGAYIWQNYEEQSRPMPIAIAVGHHPALLLGAVSKIRGVGGEYDAAGALLGEPVRVVRAEDSDLLVPADAEIVIEGEVLPNVHREEGPFGEWPGHYMAGGPKPVIKVSTITLRSDAIYHDVFSANREHLLMGSLPRMGSVFRTVKDVVPGLTAVNIPSHSRMHCYISIKKKFDEEVKKAAFTALTTAAQNLRMVVVVDDDINVYNDGDVLWAIGTRFDAERDLLVIPRWSGPGGLQPAGWEYHEDGSRSPRMITAMVLDATKPAPPIPYPERAAVPQEAVEAADETGIADLTELPQTKVE